MNYSYWLNNWGYDILYNFIVFGEFFLDWRSKLILCVYYRNKGDNYGYLFLLFLFFKYFYLNCLGCVENKYIIKLFCR